MNGFSLLDTTGFFPRWDCGSWTPAHGWLHIASDLGVWSAYVAIPCVLGYFTLRRRDLPFRNMFVLFGAFILACGATHLMDATLFWWPAYRLAGAIKLATALISWATVIALIPTVPKVLAMRNPSDLETEIRERQRAEVRFRSLLESAPDAIVIVNQLGAITLVNRQAEFLFGYPREQMLGQPIEMLMPERFRKRHLGFRANYFAQPAARPMGASFNLFGQRKDGSEFPVEISLSPLVTAEGVLVSSAIRDLTGRNNMLAALDESRRLVERVAETVPSILYVYDLNERRNLFVNQRVQSILGLDAEETKKPGTTLLGDNVHPDDVALVDWAHDQILATDDGAVVEIEFRIRHANGDWRWLHTRDTVFQRDADGTPTQVLGTLQDITDRKRLEQEVVEIAAAEQRRIGQELHDGTGQELTGLCMLADNLTEALRENSPQDAQMARRIAEGLRQALGQVRALSRGLIPVEVDAEGLMASLTELTNRISGLQGVRCVFECHDPVPMEDNPTATQLYRIAQEAITNAIKHGQARNIRVSLEARGQYLTLKITDDGRGFGETGVNSAGMGLRIMRYRASQIGAQFAVAPGPTKGVVVSCTIFRGHFHA